MGRVMMLIGIQPRSILRSIILAPPRGTAIYSFKDTI
jgi:hypothetical protein